MRGLSLIAFLSIAWFVIPTPRPASADGCTTTTITAGGGYGGMNASGEEVTQCGGPETGGGGTSTPGTWHTKPACLGGAATCDEEGRKFCEDGSPMLYIWFVPEGGTPGTATINCPTEADTPTLTLADILTAFRQIPLPASEIQIQPPDGETLVNFPTNFLTDADAFNRTVTLLDRRVDFQIRAQSFAWAFGDGATTHTTTPGAAYPSTDITHVFRKRGTVKASVNTTWTADYRVDGGAWSPVPDAVTIAGAAQSLTVRSATPLVADGH